jgi:hypothetical protein
VLTAPRPEPVAEPQELRLVDRRQDRHHRRLDDLILHCGNAERPLPAIRLRDVHPSRWQRPIRSPMDPCVQVREVGLEGLRVARPCQPVGPGGGVRLRIKERRVQDVDADVMQERRELLLPVPGDGLSYASLRL